MNQAKIDNRCEFQGRTAWAASVLLALFCVPAWSQNAIDADADGILLGMSIYLKSQNSFSVDYDADQEIVDKAGQKIQYSASGSITASRGKGFLMTRKGPMPTSRSPSTADSSRSMARP